MRLREARCREPHRARPGRVGGARRGGPGPDRRAPGCRRRRGAGTDAADPRAGTLWRPAVLSRR
ncbi:hypothetical protein EBN03_10090 [Nocardia stercoris]|uniref:Uncharacterized protein n=1 Tax=Nocardia stercoris TaxID=2483361 RepID=A0A3M2LBY3_9NOCA|nr:hypothetical protein EBN03_10090 [Nocardia stercoris]